MITNINLATNTNYKLEITPPGFAPEDKITFLIQSVDLPGVSLMAATSGGYRNNKVFVPGDTLDYDDLTFITLLAENYENYIAILRWLKEMARSSDIKNQMVDCVLHVLSNNKTPNIKFTFYGAFPTNLGGFSLDSSATTPFEPTVLITFKYQYFDIDIVEPEV